MKIKNELSIDVDAFVKIDQKKTSRCRFSSAGREQEDKDPIRARIESRFF